ncbi:MAG: hypothetical protein V4508_27185 [Pseudomonadota bacterium]
MRASTALNGQLIAWCALLGGCGSSATPAVLAPAITVQPANLSVAVGTAVNFSVTVSGTAPLSYQWKRDGADITGATSASVALPAAQLADTHSKWSVTVRNGAGSVSNAEASLSVSGIGLVAGAVDTGGYVDGVGSDARFGCVTGDCPGRTRRLVPRAG